MLLATVPRFQTDQKQALAWHDPGVRMPARWPRVGSWIGGDRDGNPNVTAAVTVVALWLNRRRGIGKVRLAAREQACTLRVSDRRDTVVPALEKELRVNLHGSRHIGELGNVIRSSPIACCSACCASGSCRWWGKGGPAGCSRPKPGRAPVWTWPRLGTGGRRRIGWGGRGLWREAHAGPRPRRKCRARERAGREGDPGAAGGAARRRHPGEGAGWGVGAARLRSRSGAPHFGAAGRGG